MIRCERLSVERWGQIVVDRVSLDVPAGRALGVIGRTGAGKSSLVAALGGALPIHGGDFFVNDISGVREPERARRLIGYAPARLDAWPAARAADVLELFSIAAGLPTEAAKRAIERGLAFARLAPGKRVDRLADGAAKRLLVARALINDPEVLLLDDPFSGLDPFDRGDVEQIIGDATLLGRTVVAALDDAHVPDCFTHLAVLAAGRITAEGEASPAAFAAGRTWRHRFICRGGAAEALDVLRPLTADAAAIDADTIDCRVDPSRAAMPRLVEALVRVGLSPEAASFHPPWTAQLLDGDVRLH
jgi:ABC-type multidrug transport system ATPase subunit